MCQTTTLPTARTFTVNTIRGSRTVESPYTDEEAITALSTANDNFATDLVRQHGFRGRLTPCQWAWVHVLAVEHAERSREERQGVEALVQDELQMDAVVRLLTHGGEKLKFPKLRLRDANGRNYVLSLAGPKSRAPGSVHVKAADSGVYLGRIATDGLFFPTRSAADFPGLVDVLARLAADPVAVAREYGSLTGNCCFCGLGLTDPRSVQHGWGPVCAKNWGLDW